MICEPSTAEQRYADSYPLSVPRLSADNVGSDLAPETLGSRHWRELTEIGFWPKVCAACLWLLLVPNEERTVHHRRRGAGAGAARGSGGDGCRATGGRLALPPAAIRFWSARSRRRGMACARRGSAWNIKNPPNCRKAVRLWSLRARVRFNCARQRVPSAVDELGVVLFSRSRRQTCGQQEDAPRRSVRPGGGRRLRRDGQGLCL